jgi:threonine dehydrogenase-like Zn-dependent dehydrogenase
MVLNDLLILPVPNGLAARHAALTEPLAVGVHAVNKSRIDSGDAAIVLGCGPVGLAVIASLASRGIGPIVAADFSPARRRLAEHFGAHVVVDPSEQSAIAAWRRADGQRPLVIFEAVGVPGMIDQAMRVAPRDTRIVVVGVCMQQDHMQPMIGILRELSVQFVLGYTPEEFAATLDVIAAGALDLDPLVTGTVGVDDVPQAFVDLANPEAHAKILVEPGRS